MSAVFTVVLAGLRARLGRLFATAAAVVLGVAFVSGTLVFSDTAEAGIYDQLARFARNASVAVHGSSSSVLTGPAIPSSTLDVVESVEGVAEVSGRMSQELPVLDKDGRLLGSQTNQGIVVYFGDSSDLDPFDLASGRLPETPGEAALEAQTAERGDFALGDTVTVLDSEQTPHSLTVVGTVDCGTSSAVSDTPVVLLTSDGMAEVSGMTDVYSILVTADEGVSQEELTDRVRSALSGLPELTSLSDELVVETGDDYRFDLVNSAVKNFQLFLDVVLIFAGIACVVASFVIYNTFTILLAGRVRETALLRCVGASRSQVFGTVLLEALAVGLIGSALGIGLGVALAFGFTKIGGQMALVADHPLVFTVTPVIVAVLLGTVVTLASAAIPALRTTSTSPLAALRMPVNTPSRRTHSIVLRAAVAGAIGVLGTGVTVLGLRSESPKAAALLVVIGGIVNFLALLVVSPLLVGPLMRALGWLPGRLFGSTTRIAIVNARRVPGRTASTMAALMIGIGLIAAATVATSSVKATTDQQITTNYPIDYFLQSSLEEVAIPTAVADQLSLDSRLEAVVRVRSADATVSPVTEGTREMSVVVGAIEPEGLAQLPTIELTSGSLDDLRPGTVVLGGGDALLTGRSIGDTVEITTDSGGSAQYTIVGLANGYIAQMSVVLAWEDLASLVPDQSGDSAVLVRASGDVDPSESRDAVRAVTDDYPLVEVDSMAEVRQQITSSINSVIAVIAALLALAIVISLIGIMNTMSLSVLERTQESATLRALGLTRGQLRVTIIAEALLIALGGALVGGGVGALYGYAATSVMFGRLEVILTVPVGQLILYISLAALAGTLAALLPARKAARASVVAAMADV